MALKSAMGSFPVPPTLTARSRAMNTAMLETVLFRASGDKPTVGLVKKGLREVRQTTSFRRFRNGLR
jgi:hypothetical protein